MSVLADLPRRTRIVALLGLVSAAGSGLGLGFAPIVRSRVARAAERRGLEIKVGELSLGAGAIWLKDVELPRAAYGGHEGARELSARVGFGWHFNVTEIAVHGALLEVSGDLEELQSQYAAYRAERPKEARASESGPRYAADGVDVTWSSPSAPSQHIWGLSYARDGERESIALDLARVDGPGIEIEARHPRARIGRVNDERQLESMQAEGLDVSIGLESAPKSSPLRKRWRGSEKGHHNSCPIPRAERECARSSRSCRCLPPAHCQRVQHWSSREFDFAFNAESSN